jgi:glycolate oxidase FAD binding subunit
MTLDAGLRARLEQALGSAPEEHATLELEGAKLEATLRPRTAAGLAAGLAVLAEAGLGVLVRGGGSALEQANAPCRADLLLETTGIDAPPRVELDEGVVWVAGGTPLAEVHAALEGSGSELPVDPPEAGATLGGSLARGVPGVRGGPARGAVLGLEVARPTGDVSHCGGRVVKNVTGYDLNKLYTGSHGSLGVITGAWLRLRPVPAARLGLLVAGVSEAETVLAAARRPTVRIAVLETGTDAGTGLHLELAGAEGALDEDARFLAAELGATEVDDVAERVAALRGGGPLRVRHGTTASGGFEATATLRGAGATCLHDVRHGFVTSCWPEAAPQAREAAAIDAALRRAAKEGQGAFVVEAAPVAWREGREVFGATAATLALQRALKSAYDPSGVLNPGRFVGGS